MPIEANLNLVLIEANLMQVGVTLYSDQPQLTVALDLLGLSVVSPLLVQYSGEPQLALFQTSFKKHQF